MNAIDTVTSLSVESFDEQYFQPGKPVIHKGGIKDKVFFKKWSTDYLEEKLKSRPVRVNYCDDGVFDFNKKQIKKIDVPFSQAVKYFCSEEFVSKSYYLQQTSIPHFFPELLPDLSRPDYNIPSDVIVNQNLWMGGAGCVSPLHYDSNENFLMQVIGRKELIMFAPEDGKYLYPSHQQGGIHLSQVDLDNLNLNQFPAVALAKPIRCLLEPGDVLFIPPNWWHHVRSLDMCLSVNYWWQRFDIRKNSGAGYYPMQEIVKVVQMFLQAGCDINHKLLDGETILLKAIKCNFSNVVEALLSLGANPNVSSAVYAPGSSALLMATELESQQIVRLLMKYGADASWNNDAAFNLASKKGNRGLMNLLQSPAHA